ncbi:MAG: tRNA (adenosine(37)-N6)-dimethylallyltransferase MiaA, partial [Marinilabiliales bacterium]|nr:tRNA (adenosine(37)-N6)-dimethylallyltransferase MiaA [Marinilabiliales bacterium]
LSIRLATHFGTEILSCDSRQIYREMSVGTAVPPPEALLAVPHHLIGSHSIQESYHAARFEMDVLELLERLFKDHSVAVMTGGSMLYIDAVCKGIDELPDIDPELRASIISRWKNFGIQHLRAELKMLDPEYYNEVDLLNPVRIIHALEICYSTGKSYSSQRTKVVRERNFDILKIGLNRDREELYQRINARVDQMMADGLESEARSLLPFRDLNSMNTVGYRELFSYFDGEMTREEAIEKIKSNTRRYARKQLTWFRRDQEIHWFHPDQEAEILALCDEKILSDPS